MELADSLVAGFEVTDFLHRVIDRASGLLDVQAAGIMLVDGSGRLQLLASSSHAMYLLELFELQGDSGPCVDAFRTGEAMVPPDLGSMRSRWPALTRRAEAAGFSTVQAVPMRLRDEVIGALSLFGTREGLPTGTDLKLARALADVATVALITERTMTSRQVLTDQLQDSLSSRVLLEQAKGTLAERAGIDLGQASTSCAGKPAPAVARCVTWPRPCWPREAAARCDGGTRPGSGSRPGAGGGRAGTGRSVMGGDERPGDPYGQSRAGGTCAERVEGPVTAGQAVIGSLVTPGEVVGRRWRHGLLGP